MCHKVALGIAVVMLLGADLTRADDSVLDQLYGKGVHSYFSGDYSRAYDSLSSAINGGSRDPRVYYFRAFAESRLGREQDATMDFQTGATYEATGGSASAVSQALERIQGPARATLEQYRENARATALQAAPTQSSGAPLIQRREAVEPMPTPPSDQLRPLPPVTTPPQSAPKVAPPGKAPIPPQSTPAEKAAEPMDPFSSEPAKPAETPPAKPAAPPVEKPAVTPEQPGPVGDSAKPADKPADKAADAADPFNSDAKPATPPAAKPADKATEKTAEKPADADPFNSETKPAAPADKNAAPPADAKAPAGKDAAADIKPQPAAARGVIKALNFGDMFGNTAANLQKAAAGALHGQATPAPAAAPTATSGTTAAASADPFSAPPAAAAAGNGSPPAAASPAPAGKASDPFADEPAAKGGADAKAPVTARPDMKKDQDPFKN